MGRVIDGVDWSKSAYEMERRILSTNEVFKNLSKEYEDVEVINVLDEEQKEDFCLKNINFRNPNQKIMVPVEPIFVVTRKLGKEQKDTKRASSKGIYNAEGDRIIPCNYKFFEFHEDFFIATAINGKMGVFNYFGQIMFPVEYDELKNINGIFVTRKKNEAYKLFTKRETLINTDYEVEAYEPFLNSCGDFGLIVTVKGSEEKKRIHGIK